MNIKPRNKLVVLLTKRKAGPHGKTYKTIRRDNKVALKQKDYSDKLIKFFRVVFSARSLVGLKHPTFNR